MGRYNKNSRGFYPSHGANGKSKEVIEDVLTTIRFVLRLKLRDQRLRCFVNDVFEYLERTEGFHYGLSEKVLILLKNGEISTENVILDHAVPSVIINKALKLRSFNTNCELKDFLRNHYSICFITKDENKILNKKKYKQRMPDGWNIDFDNWDARYKKAGIKIAVNPGLN